MQGVVTCAAVHEIVTVSTGQEIVARPADQGVVAGLAVEGVVAAAAVQGVVAVAAVQGVVTRIAAEDVVARPAGKDIVAVAAEQFVGILRTFQNVVSAPAVKKQALVKNGGMPFASDDILALSTVQLEFGQYFFVRDGYFAAEDFLVILNQLLCIFVQPFDFIGLTVSQPVCAVAEHVFVISGQLVHYLPLA